MSASPWQLSKNLATLRTAELCATIDLRQPAAGLRIEKLGEQAIDGIALFGVQIDALSGLEQSNETAAAADAPLDCFVRGNDLVATYAETTNRPFRAQVYWRFVEPIVETEAAPPAVAVELIVSVQTSRLDIETALAVCTTIGHVESWQLLDAFDRAMSDGALPPGAMPTALRGHASLDPSRPSNPTLTAAAAPPRETVVPDFHHPDSRDCCLVRLAGLSRAYLEMVHPSDFRQTTFEGASQSPPVVRLTHRLFAERLEKGVILRSRIRGIFLPRAHAEELARLEFRLFADSKLPLTT